MSRRGIAIIVTLLVIAVVIILSFTIISLGVQNLNHAESHLYSKKALLAAEAGVNQSLRRLKANPAWSGQGLPGKLSGGPETYTVEVVNNSSGATSRTASNGAQVPAGTTYLLSTGVAREGANTRRVGVLVQGASPGLGWRFGLFGHAVVNLGNGLVDSFDSRIGPYSTSRNPKGGGIGTNNPDRPPDAQEFPFPDRGITVGPQGKVNAVEIGPSGVPGQVAQGVNPAIVRNLDSSLGRQLDLVEPPFAPGSGSLKLNSSGPLAPGAYGDLSVSGNATVSLSPGVYVCRTLSVGGKATLRVATGVVKIYVVGDGGNADDLTLGGNSLTNSSMVPGNVEVYVGLNAREVKINGGPQVAMALLAPLCEVVLDGSAGGFYGAIVGHSVDCNGQPQIHYDEALSKDVVGSEGKLEIISWQRY